MKKIFNVFFVIILNLFFAAIVFAQADENARGSADDNFELIYEAKEGASALAEAQQPVADPNAAIYQLKAQQLEKKVELLTKQLAEAQQPVADPNAAVYQRKAQQLEKKVELLTKQLAEAQQPVADPNAAVYQRKAQDLEKKVELLTQQLAEAQQPVDGSNAAIYQRKAQQLEIKVSDLSQGLGKAYHTLGEIYTQKKMYPEAIDAYDKAMQYNPEDKLVYYHAGLLYAYMGGASEKAIELLQRYLNLDPHALHKKKAMQLIKLLGD